MTASEEKKEAQNDEEDREGNEPKEIETREHWWRKNVAERREQGRERRGEI